LGAFHTSIGLVALPGGLIAGLLWDVISPEATFVYAVILTVISVLLVAFVKEHEISQHHPF
ncbi:MAG: MFS transporter, partial [Candidatus Syntropharchaeales archaeon]